MSTRATGERTEGRATGGIRTGAGAVRRKVAAGTAAPLIGWTSAEAMAFRIVAMTSRIAPVRVEEPGGTKGTGTMAGVATTDRGVRGDAMTRICSAEARQAATSVGALALGHHACVTRTVDESVIALGHRACVTRTADESVIDLGAICSVRFATEEEVTRTITLRVVITGTPVARHVKKMARPRPWQRPGGNGARLGTTQTVG